MSVAGLAALAEDVASALTGTAGPGPLTIDDLAGTFSDIKAALLIINDALEHANREARLAVTAATDAATQAEAVGQDLNDITGHTYRIIIPHSLSWLAGYIMSHWIEPLRKAVAKLDKDIKFLMGWRGQIDSWRHTWVDPQLKQWHGFHVWFNTWPLKTLNQLHTWLTHPAEFGSWLAPYVVRPLVSWLLSSQHTVERDALMLGLADSMVDDPNLVWEAVLRWLDSDG